MHPSILKINEIVNPIDTFSFEKVNQSQIEKVNQSQIEKVNQSQIEKVNQSQIEKEIMNLNPKKAAGADFIPPNVIKDSVTILKSSLAQFLNNSAEECIFPSDLKYANVAPLFKKDDNTNKENYRPIRIVSNKLSTYLCGFRKGYNAQHALLRLKDNLNKCLDKKEKVGLFMMDCIPHELLVAKLHAYDFNNKCLKLIYSYMNLYIVI